MTPHLPARPPVSPSARPAPARLPILIGITGDAWQVGDERHDLQQSIRDYFDAISRRHPHSPVIVITALAETTERLAARVALESGCRLQVPLPMPQTLYESEFPDSVADFRQLLELADEVIELPLLPGNPPDHGALPDDRRRMQHAALNAWICRNCHELIAIGEAGRGSAGRTAEAVGFRLESIPPRLGKTRSLLDSLETGPVFHIPLDAAKATATATANAGKRLVPPGDKEARLIASWHGIERFNREVLDLARTDLPLADLPVAQAARQLANHHNAARRRVNIGVLGLGILAAIALQLYSMVDTRLPMADVYAVFFMVIGLLYGWGKRRQFNERRIEYTALAEALRIQAFWHRAGIHEVVPEFVVSRHADQLGWVYEALKTAALPPYPASQPALAVLQEWISQVRAETVAQSARFGQWAKRLENSVYACYGISFVFSIILYVLPSSGGDEGLANTLIAGLGISASLGTLLLIFNGSMGYATQAAMQDNLLHLLDQAAAIADHDLPAHEVDELIVDLGREILQHQGDWLLMQR